MSRPYDSNPPAYPPQAHYDAGPFPPPGPIASPAPSPYNAYGGFAHPSNDPRSAPQYPGSPGPQPYYNNNNNNNGGPMAVGPGYGQPQGMYYGQPQPQQQYMYGGPPGGGYGGYGGQGGYYDQRGHGGGAAEGVCAGLMGALACCCCLDFLI
ncbi:hypothetical protein MMC34_001615 [Xylographa carneopallida]|nr:hypothetical protein [Xylographa carneopallida]